MVSTILAIHHTAILSHFLIFIQCVIQNVPNSIMDFSRSNADGRCKSKSEVLYLKLFSVYSCSVVAESSLVI